MSTGYCQNYPPHGVNYQHPMPAAHQQCYQHPPQQQQYYPPQHQQAYPTYPAGPMHHGGMMPPPPQHYNHCHAPAMHHQHHQMPAAAPTPQHQYNQPVKRKSAPYTHSPYAQSICSNDAHETSSHTSHGTAPVLANNNGNTESFETASSSMCEQEPRRNSMSDDSSDGDAPNNMMDYANHAPSEKRVQGLLNITLEVIHTTIGKVTTIAGSPHGSSFLQAALRQYPIEAFEIIYKEVAPVMGKLLLDKHACYVVKMVLEMMDKEEAIAHLDALASNEELLMTLCTKDLHSRRMIQFILDFTGPERCRYLLDLVMRRPMQIVRTQQGCITLQRVLDHFSNADKETFFATVRGNFMEYALDPFGNYIIQYMLTEGNQVENSNTLALYCRGQLHNMICHKYASNVIEKCFGLVTPELQHDIIEEMFNAAGPSLMRILSDSSANYVVQAAIRSASFRDVTFINNKIGAILPHVQSGKKLQQRLQRRLKH